VGHICLLLASCFCMSAFASAAAANRLIDRWWGCFALRAGRGGAGRVCVCVAGRAQAAFL
jgi:hypothetical protein